MTTIKRRVAHQAPSGWDGVLPPVIQKIYASRGVCSPPDIELKLSRLHSPILLGGIERAAKIIGEAILQDLKITIAGDYDCDGATGAAVAVKGLRLLGAQQVDFVVPNRFVHGYGLSPALVDSMSPKPDLIITVDSGVSSNEGVTHANALGIKVVVTDHHLPGEILPDAEVIVNPNLKDDPFPSKMLAGVGVMFYTLLAVRAYLRKQGAWMEKQEPDLTTLLDLVAIGTVADLVPLDQNNRILVEGGLRRIRSGQASVGVTALIEASGRRFDELIASDIGFAVAPRLNAAGRLEDMRLGVQTLICDNPLIAKTHVAELDRINRERKELQAGMIADAEQMLIDNPNSNATGVVVYDPSWHAGIVGLVASRVKDTLYRPVIALAPAGEGSDELRGSARSIPGFHLRDALALIDARNPGLILKFGGHAMAAGLSLKTVDVERFTGLFDEVAKELLSEELLNATIFTDGELSGSEFTMDFARLLRSCGPWGQGFPEPVFDGVFKILEWKEAGSKHVRFVLQLPNSTGTIAAIFFNGLEKLQNLLEPSNPRWDCRLRFVYELNINVWATENFYRESVQLMVRHIEKP